MKNKTYQTLAIFLYMFFLVLLMGSNCEISAENIKWQSKNIESSAVVAENNPQEILQEIKSEVVSRQNLSKDIKGLGTFGYIIDKLFSIPYGFSINSIKVKEYAKGKLSYKVCSLLDGNLTFMIVRLPDGELSKVVFFNEALFPFESRTIELDFNNPNYPKSSVVKININTFKEKIKYTNLLLFNLGQTEPYWVKDKSAKLWGKNTIFETQDLLNQIFTQVIKYHQLDPEADNLGFFDRFRNSIVDLPEKRLNDNDILLLSDINLQDMLNGNLQADCYLITDFFSASVIKDVDKKEVKTIFTIFRVSSDKIISYQLDFQSDGINVLKVAYNPVKYESILLNKNYIPLSDIQLKSKKE